MALKVVVIGTGFGKYGALPAFKALGCDVQLVSPRDDQAVAQAIANSCDLVSIHSPPFMHVQHVTLALAHGCHVLCDKPFGRNAAEAQYMLTLAEQSGMLHFLNYEFRFDPQREKLKELLDAGTIGQPTHLSYTSYLSYGQSMPHGWLFEREKGGGWIGAFASHFVDMLHWLFGDIEDVNCQTRIDIQQRKDRDPDNSTLHEVTAEDAVVALFQLNNGVSALLDTAFSARVDLPPQITLLGSEGVIQLLPDMSVLLLRRSKDPEQFQTVEDGNAMQLAMQRWIARVCEAVEQKQQITPDFTSGLQCALVLDKMRAASGIQD